MTTTTTEAAPLAGPQTGRARVVDWGDVTIGCIALGTAAILLVGLLVMEVQGSELIGPGVFPSIVAAGLAVLGLSLVISGAIPRKRTLSTSVTGPGISSDLLGDVSDANTQLIELGQREGAADTSGAAELDAPAGRFDFRAVAIAAGSLAVFTLVLQILGWIIASTLLFAAMTHAFGSRRPLFDVGIGFAIACITQLIFAGLLGLALPVGFIEGIV